MQNLKLNFQPAKKPYEAIGLLTLSIMLSVAFLFLPADAQGSAPICVEVLVQVGNVSQNSPLPERGVFQGILDRFFPKKSRMEIHLESLYRTGPAKELFTTRKKIKDLLLDDGREKLFQRNYRAAWSFLDTYQTSFSWVSGKQGYHRGMMLTPSSSGGHLSRQAYQLKELTGYDTVYSADFSWGEKMKGIFSGTSADLSAPEAGADRVKKVIYSGAQMLIEGQMTHVEGHEFDHAALNKAEADGLDTGILLPKVSVNLKESSATTGIASYPQGIDFQEMYAFANQIHRIGLNLIKIRPQSRLAELQIDELQEYVDTYIDILKGVKRLTSLARKRLQENPENLSLDQSDQIYGATLNIYLAPGAKYFLRASSHDIEKLSDPNKRKEMQKTVIINYNQRLNAIEKYCDQALKIYEGFLDSSVAKAFDEKNGLWTPEFVNFFEAGGRLVFEINASLLGKPGAEVNNRLQQLRDLI